MKKMELPSVTGSKLGMLAKIVFLVLLYYLAVYFFSNSFLLDQEVYLFKQLIQYGTIVILFFGALLYIFLPRIRDEAVKMTTNKMIQYFTLLSVCGFFSFFIFTGTMETTVNTLHQPGFPYAINSVISFIIAAVLVVFPLKFVWEAVNSFKSS